MGRSEPVLLLFFVCAAFARQPGNVEAAVNETIRRVEARDFKSASVALKRYAVLYPNDVRLWNLLGVSEGELGRIPAARDAFERGLKIAPNNVSLNENLGFLYYRQDRFADAKPYLEKAIALGSRNPGVAFSLGAAKIRTGERDRGLSELKLLEVPLADFPDYWDERGWAELAQDPAAAETDFSRALSLAPDDLRALNGAASAAEIQKLDEKALSFLLRARQAHPGDVDTLVHLGAVCLRRDLTIDALATLEHAYRIAPSNNAALYLYARAQIGVRQWQKSHDLFSEFARRIPKFADTYYALGWLDIKLNRRAEARRELEQCLRLEPNSADPRYELAQLDLDDGEIDLAEKLLRAVLDQDPKHAKANVAYGDILLKRGDFAAARAHYETAIQSNASSGAAHYKLSSALFRLDRTEEAEKERALGARLNQEELKSNKTVLRLASPDGALLSAAP
ncbi:MAG: tetratricopeptide repeat protein [Acidobacteriota bacterium]|nr:tetratricopeptide repeat protein [Acidobacteriota bacterium]